MQESKHRILCLDFEIIERGGINRVVQGLKYGFEALGHTFDYYWASKRGKLRGLSEDIPTMISKRYFRLAAHQLAYARPGARRTYSELLEQYDTVLFMLPCPHDNKANQGDESWKFLYEIASAKGKKIVVTMHDNFWDRFYPWYQDVADLVDFHLYTCSNAKEESLSRLAGHYVYLPTPMDVTKAGLYVERKQFDVCWMPQWKKWKGIEKFLKACPYIDGDVSLYNAGILYHYLKRDQPEIFTRAIGYDLVAGTTSSVGDPRHVYYGAQFPHAIERAYRQHRVSVDLCGDAGTVYAGTHSSVQIEGMLYGTVIAAPVALQHPEHSPFRYNPEIYWALDGTSEAIGQSINTAIHSPESLTQIARAGLDFAVEYADARKHAATIIRHLDRVHEKDGLVHFYNSPVKGR